MNTIIKLFFSINWMHLLLLLGVLSLNSSNLGELLVTYQKPRLMRKINAASACFVGFIVFMQFWHDISNFTQQDAGVASIIIVLTSVYAYIILQLITALSWDRTAAKLNRK